MHLDIRFPNQKVYRDIPLDSIYRTIKKGTLPVTIEARLSGSDETPWVSILEFIKLDLPAATLLPFSDDKNKAILSQEQPPPIPDDLDNEEAPPRKSFPFGKGSPIVVKELKGHNLPHHPTPIIIGPINYEEEQVWIRPPKKKKRFFKKWKKKEKDSTRDYDEDLNPQTKKTGCAPAFLELIITVFTIGTLGGVGVLIAGKGPQSLLVSLVFSIAFWVFNGMTLGLLLILTFPLYCIFVLAKLVFDLSACAS